MQFMSIRKFYSKKIGRKVLCVTILYAICMFLFSILIYLNKTEKSLNEDFALIRKLEQKINQTIKLKKTLDRIIIPERKNSEIFAAQFIDSLKARFPEVSIEISNMKKEQKQLSLEMNLKAETLWNRFIDILSFLEETEYPFIFIKSVNLSPKDNTLSIDIKTELKLFYQEDDKRV